MLPPRPMMNWTAVSRERVSAIPASSMITKLDRPMRSAQSGRSPWWMDQVSLASVSAGARWRRELRRCGGRRGQSDYLAAASLHARVRVRIAVVFPAPAGASPAAAAPRRCTWQNQSGLPSIQGVPVRRDLQQCQLHHCVVDADPSGGRLPRRDAARRRGFGPRCTARIRQPCTPSRRRAATPPARRCRHRCGK